VVQVSELMKAPTDPGRVAALFRSWDTDGDGAVDLAEFRDAMTALQKATGTGWRGGASDAAIDALFREFDVDGPCCALACCAAARAKALSLSPEPSWAWRVPRSCASAPTPEHSRAMRHLLHTCALAAHAQARAKWTTPSTCSTAG
jgi:hypothetical protein